MLVNETIVVEINLLNQRRYGLLRQVDAVEKRQPLPQLVASDFTRLVRIDVSEQLFRCAESLDTFLAFSGQ